MSASLGQNAGGGIFRPKGLCILNFDHVKLPSRKVTLNVGSCQHTGENVPFFAPSLILNVIILHVFQSDRQKKKKKKQSFVFVCGLPVSTLTCITHKLLEAFLLN